MTNADTLAREAKRYLDEGDSSYEKAAERMWQLRNDFGWTFAQIAEAVGRSSETVRVSILAHGERLANPAQTYTEAARKVKPSLASDARADRTTKQTLREAGPEQIAEQFLADPAIRANVERAQEIAKRSREAERETLGAEAVAALDEQQRLRNAESELFKARRGFIELLRLLNGVDNIPDSWREEFLRTLDDIQEKDAFARAILSGSIDEGLAELLAAEAA